MKAEGFKTEKLVNITKYINRGIAPKYTTSQPSTIVINQKCVRFGEVNFSYSKLNNHLSKPIPTEKLLNSYDILINSTGTGTVGRVGQVGKITNQRITCDTHVTIVRADPNIINPLYLGFCLQRLQAQLEKLAEGSSNQIELSREKISSLIVSFPDLVKQKRIVDILFAADETINSTQKVIDQTEKLKKGLMQELLTKGIGHTRFKMTEIGEIPEEWEVCTMNDISKVRQGLQIPISKRFKTPGQNRYKYLTIKYLFNVATEKAEYIENPIRSVVCTIDDILMVRTGRTGEVITDVEGVFHNNFFLIDFDRQKVDKLFYFYFLKFQKIQKLIIDRAGSTTIPDLNHGDFYSLPISIPPFKEQKEIVNLLLSIDQKIEINKKLKTKQEQLKRGLMQDLLTGKVRV